MKVNYYIENKNISFKFIGVFDNGEDTQLISEDADLFKRCKKANGGFLIHKIFKKKEIDKLSHYVSLKMKQILKNELKKNIQHFKMEKYHEYVSDEEHLLVLKKMGLGWSTDDFPFSFSIIEKRMSSLLKMKVSAWAKHIKKQHKKELAINNIISRKPSIFSIRIVRPMCHTDCNPPHKDAWIERLRNGINIYAPLCGSTKESSLPLVPDSHHLNENVILRTIGKYKFNGVSYTVPVALSINNNDISLIRPNPKIGQALIFSPYLIHGGAYNFEKNKTRFSLECRFWLC